MTLSCDLWYIPSKLHIIEALKPSYLVVFLVAAVVMSRCASARLAELSRGYLKCV